MQKTRISLLIRIVGFFLSVLTLHYFIDLGVLIPVLYSVPWKISVLAMGIASVRIYLTAIRWQILSPDAAGLTQWQCFRLIMGSGALNLFLPGTIGADVARSVLAMNEAKSERGSTFLSVIVDRVIGLQSIIFLGLIACLMSPHLDEHWFYITVFSVLALSLFIVLQLIRTPRLQQFMNSIFSTMGKLGRVITNYLNHIFDAMQGYKLSLQRIIVAFMLCIPIHILWFLLVYLISHALRIEITFFTISMVTTLVWLITILPVTLAGLGVRELGFIFLLSMQGVGEEQAVALALYQSAIIIIMAIIGLPFLWIGKRDIQ